MRRDLSYLESFDSGVLPAHLAALGSASVYSKDPESISGNSDLSKTAFLGAHGGFEASSVDLPGLDMGVPALTPWQISQRQC